MSSQVFLWVNLGVAVLLVLLFVLGRKSFQNPSKLNLRKGTPGYKRPVVVPRADGKPDVHFQKATDLHVGEKSLNVMFMFNGHSFDAFEVLGLPAGARDEMVEKAYEKAVKERTHEKDFLDAARIAIRQDRKS